MNKTRPITLLQTHRKIFEGIITKRMTKIIDENELLKGNNIGFKTGVSAMSSLLVVILIEVMCAFRYF